MYTPSDLMTLAEIGVRTGTNWGLKYPELAVKNLTQADYLAFHQDFHTSVVALLQARNDRKQLVNNLKVVNMQIDSTIKGIKRLIAAHYPKKQQSAQYMAHSIVRAKTIYTMPRDNDNRINGLDILINTMSATDHPFANDPIYGLATVIQLRDTHHTVWTLAKNTDDTLGFKSSKMKNLKLLAKQYQSQLRRQVAYDYIDIANPVLQGLGF
jgi:hypothetical protein